MIAPDSIHHPWNAIVGMTREQRAVMDLYEVIPDGPPPEGYHITGTTLVREGDIIREAWITQKIEPVELNPYPELTDAEIHALLEKLAGI